MRHCYLFGGLFGQVGWSLRHNIKTLIISLSEAFAGPTAALPTTVFYSIVVGVLGNSG